MIALPRVRKLALVAHVASAVGWLGAVGSFAALAVVGLTSEDPVTVRGVYRVMEPAAWVLLLPLAFASLVTGLLQSVLTPWGVFRHYWIVFKLLINVVGAVVLLVYMDTFAAMAEVAADPSAELSAVRNASPLLHAGGALVLLLVATGLAVYKPRGTTPLGRKDGARTLG